MQWNEKLNGYILTIRKILHCNTVHTSVVKCGNQNYGNRRLQILCWRVNKTHINSEQSRENKKRLMFHIYVCMHLANIEKIQQKTDQIKTKTKEVLSVIFLKYFRYILCSRYDSNECICTKHLLYTEKS